MMPRSEWLAWWSLRYAQKCSKELGEKLKAKFPATTPGCSMVKKNCPLWWRFLRSFLSASKPSRRSITAEKRKQKEKKKRGKNSKIKKPQNFDFCARPRQNVVKRDASGKKGKLPSFKCIFDQIKANFAEIQPQNHQNVEETHFCQKAPGVNGLIGFQVWKRCPLFLWITIFHNDSNVCFAILCFALFCFSGKTIKENFCIEWTSNSETVCSLGKKQRSPLIFSTWIKEISNYKHLWRYMKMIGDWEFVKLQSQSDINIMNYQSKITKCHKLIIRIFC